MGRDLSSWQMMSRSRAAYLHVERTIIMYNPHDINDDDVIIITIGSVIPSPLIPPPPP
jgi:hypothetical protein